MTGYTLDTNICIYLVNRRSRKLEQRLRDETEAIAVSSVVYAELLYGVEKSKRAAANRRELEAFLAELPILEFGRDAARHYGDIRAKLERQGTPIGSNDLLIGAHARSLDLTLVTNNRREFDRIPGLKVENWAEA